MSSSRSHRSRSGSARRCCRRISGRSGRRGIRSLRRPLVVILIALAGYALVRLKRPELVDFAVIETAAERSLAHEPLYRPDDGHFQYKYLPAFAIAMVPFTWPPKAVAEAAWFVLAVGMTWAFVRISLNALPDRRVSERTLVWLTLLLNGKFLVKELAFGQFNLPLALLFVGALVAARRDRPAAAGTLVGLGVFVKPYALVLLPWLVWTRGWRPLVPFAAVVAAGLLAPVVSYGWSGNLALHQEWYRTVTETTAPNLLVFENISFASMWAKWLGPGMAASRLALASAVAALGVGVAVMVRRRNLEAPDYLECAYFFVLVPLLSPQGWDYVLLLALPAHMLLVDRWRDSPLLWRAIAATGLIFTSFTIFDLWRRALYTQLMAWGVGCVGAVLIAACLVRMRWRALA